MCSTVLCSLFNYEAIEHCLCVGKASHWLRAYPPSGKHLRDPHLTQYRHATYVVGGTPPNVGELSVGFARFRPILSSHYCCLTRSYRHLRTGSGCFAIVVEHFSWLNDERNQYGAASVARKKHAHGTAPPDRKHDGSESEVRRTRTRSSVTITPTLWETAAGETAAGIALTRVSRPTHKTSSRSMHDGRFVPRSESHLESLRDHPQ
jgi:hypothetical protein